MAMLLATLVAMITFGRACGFDRVRLLQFAEESLTPIASVLLVVGAGGGFGRVLDLAASIPRCSGDERTAAVAARAWMGDRVPAAGAVGSATVAVVTAASIMVPIAAAAPNVNRELLVVSIGAGSLIASHVNDGGFWLVKEY